MKPTGVYTHDLTRLLARSSKVPELVKLYEKLCPGGMPVTYGPSTAGLSPLNILNCVDPTTMVNRQSKVLLQSVKSTIESNIKSTCTLYAVEIPRPDKPSYPVDEVSLGKAWLEFHSR